MKVESAAGGRGASWAGAVTRGAGGGGGDKKWNARREAIHAPIKRTLASIAGPRLETSLLWKRWWKRNRSTFKVSPLPVIEVETPKKGQGSVAGRVDDPMNGGMSAHVFRDDGMHVSVEVDGDGVFRILNLPPGKYRLQVVAPGGKPVKDAGQALTVEANAISRPGTVAGPQK